MEIFAVTSPLPKAYTQAPTLPQHFKPLTQAITVIGVALQVL